MTAHYNIYHGGPVFDSAGAFSDAIVNKTGASVAGDHIFISSAANFVAFFGTNLTSGSGVVTSFLVYNTASPTPTTPPLLVATDYSFTKDALNSALFAYHALNPAPFLALLNVATSFNGSNDNDTIIDFTTLGSHIHGNAGDDILLGRGGKDVIDGGDGDDRITGGGGKDILGGGDGNNTFIFDAGFGKDHITDFKPGAVLSDVIDIDHLLIANFKALKADVSLVNGDVVLSLDAQNTITLDSVHHLTDLRPNDFLFT